MQCFNQSCLELRTTLTPEQREATPCPHIIAAQKAAVSGDNATKKSVDLATLQRLLNEDLFKKVESTAKKGKIRFWAVPDNTYVVPSYEPANHDSPTEYIHIKDGKCPLSACKEKKNKVHSLAVKEVPLCVHNILIHSTVDPPVSTDQPDTNSTKPKLASPKMDRESTVKNIVTNISEHFPSITKMEQSGFVQKSRRYVEKLISNKPNLNDVIKKKCPLKCTTCPDSQLDDWSFKPKQAFLLSMGHLVKIEIPLKICNNCESVFYPGNYSGVC